MATARILGKGAECIAPLAVEQLGAIVVFDAVVVEGGRAADLPRVKSLGEIQAVNMSRVRRPEAANGLSF